MINWTASDERGMTLIELVAAIAILGIIAFPLFGSFFFAVNSTASSRERVSDSTGAQLTSSLFLPDVQSSDAVRSSGFKCGGANTVVELDLSSADPTITALHVVDYNVLPDPTDPKLQRSQYTISGSTCTLDTTATLLHAAVPLTDSVVANRPSVTCTPSPCGTLAADGVTDTTRTVVLQLTAMSIELANQPAADTSYTAYTFQSVATRRMSP